jgi:hypothetical protein
MTVTLKINNGAVADFGSDWVEFSKWLDGTYGKLPYKWTDLGEEYVVIAADGSAFYKHVQFKKTDETAKSDFEENYKNARKTVEKKADDGVTVVAPLPYAYSPNEKTRFQGHMCTCAPGTTTHTLELNSKIRLQGGTYWVKNPSAGDYVSLAVVDIDNVLQKGHNVQLSEYVKTHYVAPWDHVGEFQASTTALLESGTYLKVTYTNVGNSSVQLGITYKWLEC